MVNIKGFIQFYLGDTADLAGMIIPLSGSASLPLPILAIPMIGIKVAFPSRIIQPHLPLRLPPSFTLPRAKAVFGSFMAFRVNNVTAILTSKIKLWIIAGSIYATSINRLTFVATFIRAIRMLATLNLRSLAFEFLATYFTSHTRSIA